MRYLKRPALYLTIILMISSLNGIPTSFIKIKDINDEIIISPRYFTQYNFVGRQIDGYTCPNYIITKEAGNALAKVQKTLQEQGYNLVIYDSYRPQYSVDYFVKWSQDSNDTTNKTFYYPTVPKDELFDRGYIANKSGHTRGSTIDATIIKIGESIKPITVNNRNLTNGDIVAYLDDNTVDMWTSFDLFHEASHQDTDLIPQYALENRQILRDAMKNNGFSDYQYEWWHFTLENEPYKDTYFNFTVDCRS